MKLLDPATSKKVAPPSSVNPAAPLVVVADPAVANPSTAAEKAKKPSAFSVRIPGKTGITLRLPPRNPTSTTKPNLPTLVIKPLKGISPSGPSPKSAKSNPSPTVSVPPAKVTLKLSRPSPTVATPSSSFTTPQPISNDTAKNVVVGESAMSSIASVGASSTLSTSAPGSATVHQGIKLKLKAPKAPPAVAAPIVASTSSSPVVPPTEESKPKLKLKFSFKK